MRFFWNSRTGKFPFNNRGEVLPAAPPAAEVIPKTKEEWDKLAKEDPARWISLTQGRMDQFVREGREWKEKATAAETRSRNLEMEVASLKKPAASPGELPPEPPGIPGYDPEKPFSRQNLPRTDADWDRLFIDDPKLATDLRVEQANQMREMNARQQDTQKEFAKARKESAKDLWDRHPDMYVQEMEADGVTSKKDAQGKPVLKIDPNIGGPILNLESEKGKLFVEVYNEDSRGYDSAKTGPRLAMLEMERRLVNRGMQQMGAGQGGQAQGQGAQAPVLDQRGTLPGGVTPPVTSRVTFASDEEKAHAEKAVSRGIYKDLAEYCTLRDGGKTGITEEGVTPQFGT